MNYSTIVVLLISYLMVAAVNGKPLSSAENEIKNPLEAFVKFGGESLEDLMESLIKVLKDNGTYIFKGNKTNDEDFSIKGVGTKADPTGTTLFQVPIVMNLEDVLEAHQKDNDLLNNNYIVDAPGQEGHEGYPEIDGYSVPEDHPVPEGHPIPHGHPLVDGYPVPNLEENPAQTDYHSSEDGSPVEYPMPLQGGRRFRITFTKF